MDSKSTSFLSFDFPSQEDWKLAAQQELQEAKTDSLFKKKGSLDIEPIYFSSNQQSNQLIPSANIYGGPRFWANMPRIEVQDAEHANQLALEYLQTGADGIVFDLNTQHFQFDLLLKDIHLDICPISFVLDWQNFSRALEYSQFVASNAKKDTISGAIFWKTLPIEIHDISNSFKDFPQYFPIGIFLDSQPETESEIAKALIKGVQVIEHSVGKGIAPHQIINQIGFFSSIGTDFFLEIAKLKALRNLWLQIRGAYDIPIENALHIHAASTAWKIENYQPHGNMIKSTTAAMAAVLGGCNALTVEPEDSTQSMMNRIARNVSSVIREESHFSKVADATAGSYYLDSLTDHLAQKAWQKFQSLSI